MKFDWDEDKNKQNIVKHGVDFKSATQIFKGVTLDFIDHRHNYGEEREISIGLLGAIAVIVVVHTDRDGVCRIISARKANKRERQRYEQETQ
jgi:uncharacterized DUF497 family protein